MLGILLIYFIGKYFYTLAGKYGKNQWGYAILGIASYYLGTMILGIILAIGFEIWSTTSIDEINDVVLNFIALPFGLISCYIAYKLLENHWKKNVILEEDLFDIIEEIGNDEDINY